MRITIKTSALEHGVTPQEIRAIINYAALRITTTPRKPGAQTILHIGPPTPREPWMEVIEDRIDTTSTVIFHAMMLRRSTYNAVRTLAPHHAAHLKPKFARQRR